MHMLCIYRGPWRQEDGIICPGAGVTGGCKMAAVSWELNLGFFEEQYGLTTEPFI